MIKYFLLIPLNEEMMFVWVKPPFFLIGTIAVNPLFISFDNSAQKHFFAITAVIHTWNNFVQLLKVSVYVSTFRLFLMLLNISKMSKHLLVIFFRRPLLSDIDLVARTLSSKLKSLFLKHINQFSYCIWHISLD